jgi:predicted RNase H-like nuclease
MKKRSFQVAGVDGCRAGWFAAIATVERRNSGSDAPCTYRLADSFVASRFTEVLSKTADCELVCVDMPIGLNEDNGDRMCDRQARNKLGEPRRRSVFPPPIRQCLKAKDYTEANEISFEYSGKKLTPPTWAITGKIRQVDESMTQELQRRVREIHPEISFWALNHGQPMQRKKTTVAGRNERVVLLSVIFSDLYHVVAECHQPKKVQVDDILDALAAAWTAGQAVIGKAKTLPDNPESDSKGLKMEILYPAAIMDS